MGQEGIGQKHQVQVVNCGLIGEVLVLAQPQELFAVLEEHFDLPTMVVRRNDLTGRELRVIRHQSQDFGFALFAGEHHVQASQRADLHPAGVDTGVSHRTVFLLEGEALLRRPAVTEQVASVGPGLELTTVAEEIAVALERRDKMEPLAPTGLDDRRAQVEAVEQDADANILGRLEFADQLGGQFGGLTEGPLQRPTVLLLDVQPHAPGNRVAAKRQDGRDVLMAPHGGVGQWVFHPADGLHGLAAFAFLGVVEDQLDGLSRLRRQQGQQLLGLEGQHDRRLPAGPVQEVVEAAAVGMHPLVQVAVEGADIASAPGEGNQQHEQAKVVEMVPEELLAQRFKERLEFFGEMDDLKHTGNLLVVRGVPTPSIEEIAVF